MHSIFPWHKAWFDVSSFVTTPRKKSSINILVDSKLCGQRCIPRGIDSRWIKNFRIARNYCRSFEGLETSTESEQRWMHTIKWTMTTPITVTLFKRHFFNDDKDSNGQHASFNCQPRRYANLGSPYHHSASGHRTRHSSDPSKSTTPLLHNKWQRILGLPPSHSLKHQTDRQTTK